MQRKDGNSVFLGQFYCDHKTSLKNKICINKQSVMLITETTITLKEAIACPEKQFIN